MHAQEKIILIGITQAVNRIHQVHSSESEECKAQAISFLLRSRHHLREKELDHRRKGKSI